MSRTNKSGIPCSAPRQTWRLMPKPRRKDDSPNTNCRDHRGEQDCEIRRGTFPCARSLAAWLGGLGFLGGAAQGRGFDSGGTRRPGASVSGGYVFAASPPYFVSSLNSGNSCSELRSGSFFIQSNSSKPALMESRRSAIALPWNSAS